MLYSSIKQQQLFLCIFWIAIISMIMPLKECYASGLSFTKIINSAGSTSLTVSNDPTKNTNIPLNGYFTPTFSNSVFNILNGYAGKTYIIDNTTKVKLERIVNGSTTPVGITFGATNTAMVINYANLIPGSQYKLTLKGDVTNADQTVTPGITANNNTMSLPSDTVIGFTTVAPAQPAAPSFTGATLVAGTLVLSGLPSNATNLEYCLAADGVNYAADWNDLTVTNQTAIISEQGLIPGTSKVQVCVKANPDMNTPAGVGAELTITGTVLPTPTAPSVQSAVLDGTTITLSGLPTGASNLEYSISEKGTNFTTWQVLSIASTTTQASLDTTGYTLDSSVSKIGVRVKADSSGTPAGDIATVPVVLALNVETPLVQGKTYVFASGITIYADTLNAGDNTVTVRDAKNQIVDYMNVLEPGYNDLESVYGVFLKGPGDAGTKKVVITIPIPDNIPKNEYNVCGVYDGIDMKYPNNTDPDTNDCAYWLYINNTDRSQMANNIFKVTCDDFAVDGSDHMYSVLYDTTTGPSTNQILYYGYVQGPNGNMAQKIKGIILDDSGTSEMDIYRDGVLYDHVGDKTSNNALFDRTGDLFYYDYNAKPGEFHSYKIMSYSVYGRINPFSQEITVVALSSQDIVNQTKAYIEDGTLQFSYAAGDSADSVTQGFETSTNVNKVDPKWVTCNPELGNITYTSDRPDILEFGSDCCNVFKPLDTDEAVVHVTANIQFLDPNTGNLTTVTATVPPITVKWTEETVIGNYASISKDDDAKLIAQLSAAADRSDVKTIIINNEIDLTNDIDFQGKTVQAGPFLDEDEKDNPNTEGLTLFDCQSPSCSIKNAVIDADGKRLHSVIYIDASPIIDNVQFIGMDRTKYAITATTKFCTPTISNCSFSSTEQAGIFSYWFENSLPNVTIENCTFDGAGEPGYAILIQSGEATISNCVIKGYQGKLVTGWNSANDTVFDYNPYKGLHDGFSSAGIFIRDDGQAVLHGNSISNCDSGIKIWTGEGFIYNHEVSNAQGGFNDVLTGPITVYTTVNGTEIKDADTANLKLDNTDTDVNGLDICSAADPDNPVPLYQGTLTGGQTAATYAVSGTITDASSGAAIQGATIDAGNGNTTTSGTDGSYSLYLANGTYTLTVSNTGYQTGTITIIVNGAAVTSKNLSLTLTSTAPATYAVSGVISNASGALAGATVATGSNIATTGLDGTYTLNLPTGDYTLNVSEIGYQSGTISITVKGAELSNQNLTLSPAASNDANLATVAGQAITAGGQAGTKGAPKLASISVANGIATVAAADIVKTDAGATVAFYGTDSTFTNTTSSAINLSAGALTVIYIKVTTADTTTLYYSVTINRAAAASSVTATPAINGTPTAGDTSVSGTAVSGASISLSISGTAYTGTADGTGAWSITVPALVSGNTITVTALAAGDTVSAQTTATVQAGSSTTGIYTITPTTDSAYYLNSKTNGIDTITVNSGVSGLKYFTANITTITPHTGGEKVIFEQLRGGAQINLNATGADFNTVNSATAGFNVQAHDVIKVYIVDDLTNATNFNPTVLEQ